MSQKPTDDMVEAARFTLSGICGFEVTAQTVRKALESALAVVTAPAELVVVDLEKQIKDLKHDLAGAPAVLSAESVEAEIAGVVQSVNEWDDRTSPDDYPEHLLITSEELTLILRNFAAALSSPMGGGECPHCAGTGDVSEKGRIEHCLACDGTGKPPAPVQRMEGSE